MSRVPKIILALLLSSAAATSAQAAILVFGAPLTGSQEVPPNASPGSGAVLVTIDTLAHTLRVQSNFTGLLGTTTASHIHVIAPIPVTPGIGGVATTTPSFPGFPLGVTSGVFDNSFDLTLASSYRAGFITENGGTVAGAEAALIAGLLDGRAYYNIHTDAIPSGEIRGNLTAVPEPATWALMIGGFALAGAAMRREHVKVAFA